MMLLQLLRSVVVTVAVAVAAVVVVVVTRSTAEKTRPIKRNVANYHHLAARQHPRMAR